MAAKGPDTKQIKKVSEKAEEERRRRFLEEAMRKRDALMGTKPAGRPATLLGSSIDPNAIGTTLIVGKG